MKIVIDIDEKEYGTILANAKLYKDNSWGSAEVWDAIVGGIPLPKGHGDLIDRDKLSHIYRQMSFCSTAPDFIWVSELMEVEPMIKADKGE